MKAIDRAHLDAVCQFALDTAIANNKSHSFGSNLKMGSQRYSKYSFGSSRKRFFGRICALHWRQWRARDLRHQTANKEQ
jgi:hypothetical protein